MAEYYRHYCGYVREIRRRGRRRYREKNHIKNMFCPKCKNIWARFIKI